jgi:hypothetical protein
LASDGATNIMPVAPHRFLEGGPRLTLEQIEENRTVVHRAWNASLRSRDAFFGDAYYQVWWIYIRHQLPRAMPQSMRFLEA